MIIELLSYKDRALLEEKLRSMGFHHDMESGIVCRYKIHGVIVDIMPTTSDSIGFSNKWYPTGFRNSVDYKMTEDTIIKILSSPYFIATKLEAFKGRGGGDGRTSHDFEDIVYVLENRSVVWEELDNTDNELKQYLISEFETLLSNTSFFEWLDCHVEPRNSPPATYFILEQLEKFVMKK